MNFLERIPENLYLPLACLAVVAFVCAAALRYAASIANAFGGDTADEDEPDAAVHSDARLLGGWHVLWRGNALHQIALGQIKVLEIGEQAFLQITDGVLVVGHKFTEQQAAEGIMRLGADDLTPATTLLWPMEETRTLRALRDDEIEHVEDLVREGPVVPTSVTISGPPEVGAA